MQIHSDSLRASLFAGLLFAAAALPAQSVPSAINYQGRLTDNSPQQNPLTATVNMSFELWDCAACVTPAPDRLWAEPAAGTMPVTVTGGVFNLQLGGNGVALPASVFSGGAQRWLQIYVSGEALSPRQLLTAAAYASQAQNAANAASAGDALQLGGVAAAGYQLSTAQSCGAGAFVNAISNGAASCAAPPANNLTPPVTLSGAAAGPVISATNTSSGAGINAVSAGGSGLTVTAGGTGVTVSAAGTDGMNVNTTAGGGNGIRATANNGTNAYGAWGDSSAGVGVVGTSSTGTGVWGQTASASAQATAVSGTATSSSGVINGVTGTAVSSPNGSGVKGKGFLNGGYFEATGNMPDFTNSYGVYGINDSNGGYPIGVYGRALVGAAGYGLDGEGSYTGVFGQGGTFGVFGQASSSSGYGVYGLAPSTGKGIYGSSNGGSGYAGYFNGNVSVVGTLSKSAGSFKIDHPLDPANKYLYHSFVESPDMKNLYDGVTTTDARGEAAVGLPDWFGALNRDFRYQLTVIGEFAQAIVAQEIEGNRFLIRTSKPGVKVSWQVTGIRKDVYAEAHRIPVEAEKPADERGTFLHPVEQGQPPEKALGYEERLVRMPAHAAHPVSQPPPAPLPLKP